MTAETEGRRLRFYSGARVGITPRPITYGESGRAAGSPPGSAPLPAAVGPLTTSAIPVDGEAGGCRNRLERLAKCQKIRPFQAGDEDLVCANDMVSLLSTRNGLVHDPDEIRRLREAATGWPK